MLFGAIYSPEEIENFSFKDGLVPSLIAVLIVFLILLLIILCVNLLKLINNKVQKQGQNEEGVEPVASTGKKISVDDITDEDMMVAALIATIDFANETKKDVRLVSIKQIG